MKKSIFIIIGSIIIFLSSWGILIYQSTLDYNEKYYYGCWIHNANTPANESVDCKEITFKYLQMKNDLTLFRVLYLISLFFGAMLILNGMGKLKGFSDALEEEKIL